MKSYSKNYYEFHESKESLREPEYKCDCGAEVEGEFEGEFFCKECFEKYTRICPRCHKRAFTDQFNGLTCEFCEDSLKTICEGLNSVYGRSI